MSEPTPSGGDSGRAGWMQGLGQLLKTGPWTLSGHLQCRLSGENKYVSGQILSAAGGNSWIPATGVFGVMSDAGDSQVQQQLQRILRGIAGDTYHRAQVVARVEPMRGG